MLSLNIQLQKSMWNKFFMGFIVILYLFLFGFNKVIFM